MHMAGWLPISLQNIFMGSIIIWDKFLCVQLQYGQKSLTGQSLNWLVTCRLPLLINVLCCMYLAPSSTLLCESQICCRTILLCALYRHLQVCTVLNWQCIVVRWPISALTRYHYWSWLSVAVPHDPEVVECTLLPPSSLCMTKEAVNSPKRKIWVRSLSESWKHFYSMWVQANSEQKATFVLELFHFEPHIASSLVYTLPKSVNNGQCFSERDCDVFVSFYCVKFSLVRRGRRGTQHGLIGRFNITAMQWDNTPM